MAAGQITDKDSIEALLLCLGVELVDPPKTLTRELLLTILCQEVANANPIDGICLELAETFD